MPMMCEQADLLVKALKRDVGYGGTTYIDTWVTKMAFETIAVCGLGTPHSCVKRLEDTRSFPALPWFHAVFEVLRLLRG